MAKWGGARRRAVVAVVVGLFVLVGGAGIAAAGGQVKPMISGNCGPMPPMTCVSRWTCDATGEWVPTYRAAGYACNDNVACTYNDKCNGAGACAGTTISCSGDQCNDRACNGTSACTVTPKSNGTTCNDGSLCTQTDTCQAGACVGSNQVQCSAGQCQVAGSCNPSTGQCSAPTNKPDETDCSDGSLCTQVDKCQGGVCTGRSPVTCTAGQCQNAGTCNPSTGQCPAPTNKTDGSACSDGSLCTQTDQCVGGVCTGSNLVQCPLPDQCHTSGACIPATGACTPQGLRANGTSCTDGNLCTYGEVCTNGICSGGTPKSCDPNARCGPEACNGTSTCTVAPIATDDNDPCTADACDPVHGVTHTIVAGCSQAAGGPPIVAPYPDASPPPGMPMAPGLAVDESSGTLTYAYRFDLPKARGRFQPSLVLSYKHTGTRDLGVGIGWTVEGPMKRSWELDPSTGQFTREWVDIGGTRVLMVVGPDGKKRNESGPMVLIQSATGNGYVDAAGNLYDFGSPTGMQLQTVTDVFGNETRFEYTAGPPDQLTAIAYDKYAGSSGTEHATRIELSYSNVPAGVTLDVDVSTGAALRRTTKLDYVLVKNRSSGAVPPYSTVTQYKLEYGTRGQRLVLAKVTKQGVLPYGTTNDVAVSEQPTEFTYGDASFALGAGVTADVTSRAGNAPVEWIDLDGDGRPDLVWTVSANQYWARNLTVPESTTLVLGPAQLLPGGFTPTSGWQDFNGDGVMDRLEVGPPACSAGILSIRLGQRSVGTDGTVTLSYTSGACVSMTPGAPNLYFGLTRTDSYGRVAERLLDVNGDGVLDWVEPWTSSQWVGGWRVYHGYRTASGFAFASAVSYAMTDYDFTGGSPPLSGGPGLTFPPGYAPPSGVAQFMAADLFGSMDMNGDGIPDMVQTIASSTGPDTSTHWRVRYLMRSGFSIADTAGLAFTGSPTGFAVSTQRWIDPVLDGNGAASECVPGTWHGCAGFAGKDESRLTGMAVDLDGDGLPDFLTRAADGALQVWWNRGNRFDPGGVFSVPTSGPPTINVFPSISRVPEMKQCGTCDDPLWIPGDPNSPPRTMSVDLPRLVNALVSGQLMDMNGDGIPDFVQVDIPDPATGMRGPYGAAFFPGTGGAVRLQTVKVPAGATFTVNYRSSSELDAGYAKAPRIVVATVSVGGPNVAPNGTRYWYSRPVAGSAWMSDGGHSFRGFQQTWARDTGSAMVRTTTWETDSHVTAGSARGIVWGRSIGTVYDNQPQPPQLDSLRGHTTTFRVKSVMTGGCFDPSDAANGAAVAPFIAVPTLATQMRYVDGMAMSSTATQSCDDVDAYGNPTKITVTPADGGGSYQILASYDSAATCKNCPVETWTSLDGTKATALRHSKYFYSDAGNGTHGLGTVGVGRLKFVSRKANATTWEVPSITTYLANGNPQMVQTGDFLESGGSVTSTHWMSRSFAFDSFGLRVTSESATDSAGSVVLVTETEYEPASGLPRKVTGPYVSASAAPKATKTMAYDGLGRPVAVGRGISAIGASPTTITGAVTAIVYKPQSEVPTAAQPVNVKTYGFAAPVTLSCADGGACSGYQATLADVKESIAYLDGLGRTIQVRERMGGSGTSAGNPANVTQVLSSAKYRVSGSARIDGVGRTTGALEPFYSTGDGFEAIALAVASSPGLRGAVTTFDAQGRVACSLSGVFAAAEANAAACSRSDVHDPDYRTSVKFSYAVGSVIGGAQTMTVTATAGNAITATSYDAGSRALLVVDPVLSKTANTFDLLGQARTTTRQGPIGELPQTVTTTYDLLGRVTEVADPNWLASGQPATAVTDPYGRGRRTMEYYSHGGVKKLTLPAVDIAGAPIRPYVTTIYGSLLRKTSVATYEPTYVSGLGWTFTSRTATFIYDKPRGADAATYPYVAGRLAEAVTDLTAIAFGYDQDGTPKERDQWFTPLGSTRYGASIATGNDGRAVQAQFTSLGSPTISHSLQYDSFGRPIGVVGANSGATVLWGTVTTATDGAGAYDALGRIADSRGFVQSNGGAVTTKRTYGAWSSQMLGQETKLGTTDLYRVGSMGYLGEKLTQMTDAGTGTSYAWAYDTGGRLVTATATSNTSSGLTQNYSHSFAFSPVWNLSTARVAWNGSATSTQGYSYSGTDQATQAPGGYQPSYALTYDGMGNIVDRRVPGSPTPAETLTYTAEGYLRSIVRGASTDEVLHYDALGNLAYRRSGTNLWFYAGEHATITATTACTTDPCAPTAGTVKVNVHVLLAGSRIATVRTIPGQTADQAFGSVLFYHRDRQGSVVATTTTGGVLGAQYRYGPYGELDRYAGNEATAGSDLGYTGGLRLTGGLIHLRARVYDPSYRRFLQADIVDPFRYTYTRGDPTNYVDPSGRLSMRTTVNGQVSSIFIVDDEDNLVASGSFFNNGADGDPLQHVLSIVIVATNADASSKVANERALQDRPVLAVSSGVVERVGWEDSSDHSVGYGYRITVRISESAREDYGHTTPGGEVVAVGDRVDQGQLLTSVGDPTNGTSKGPHVHFNRREAPYGRENGLQVEFSDQTCHEGLGTGRPVDNRGSLSSGYYRNDGRLHGGYDFVYSAVPPPGEVAP